MARRPGTVVAAVLLTATTGGLVSMTAAAAHAAPIPAVAEAASAARSTAPLHELRTADNAGVFYTINPAEAQRAQQHNGFRPTGEAEGISLYQAPSEGMIALHRLRLRSGHQSYLVARADSAERHDSRFVDEGVMGYAYDSEQPTTMALHRYSRDGEWRLARADRSDLLEADFTDDGVVGWVPQG